MFDLIALRDLKYDRKPIKKGERFTVKHPNHVKQLVKILGHAEVAPMIPDESPRKPEAPKPPPKPSPKPPPEPEPETPEAPPREARVITTARARVKP